MKTILSILVIVFSLNVYGQNALRDMCIKNTHSASSINLWRNDLPEANKKILEVADKKIGTRVGKGICFNFVDACLTEISPDWKDRKSKNNNYVYGKKVKKKDVLPGDVILYTRCIFKDGLRINNHVGIVYNIDDKHKGYITSVEQNVGAKTLKDSYVIIDNCDLTDENLLSGKLEFFRPY